MADTNKTIVREVFEIFNGSDQSRVDQIVAAEGIDHDSIPGVDTTGPEGFKRVVALYRGAFPDLRVTVEHVVSEGDLAVAYFRMTGTHSGDLFGIPATGKRVGVSGFDMFRVQNGKIIEHWGIADYLKMMQQLGVIPAPTA